MEKKGTTSVSRDYLESLEKKVQDLKTLVEVSSIISSTLDLSELITLVMEKAKNIMDAEACSLLLYNRATDKLEFAVALCQQGPASDTLKNSVTLDIGQGIAGWVAENREPIIVEDAVRDSRFYLEADRLTGFVTKSMIAAPLIGRSGLIGVAEIMNPKGKPHFDDYDMEIFQSLCRQVSVAMENAFFHKSALERERLRRELEIAAALQRSFLPDSPVLRKGSLTVSALNVSAEQVGGDLYDFIELDHEKTGILIGDVSGKGVFAALYMARIMSEFRHIAHLAAGPAEALQLLSDRLASSPRGMFFTCIYIVANPQTGEVQIAVAGHPPAVRTTAAGAEVMDLPAGPPAGITQSTYPSSRISLQSGERLILLTDGVFDAKDIAGVRLGFDRVVDFIRDNAPEDKLMQMLSDYAEKYSEGAPRADDMTLVEIRMGESV